MRIHKRSDSLFLQALATLLFLALCAWLGVGLYKTLAPSPVPPTSLPEAEEEVRLRGIAVRRERLLCSRRRVRIAAAEGKRLANGGMLAVAAGGSALYAEQSAIFFSSWDGLEWLAPEALCDLDVPAAQALLAAEPREQAGAYGRLVTGTDWYYVALSGDDLPLAAGSLCLLCFEGIDRALSARLLSVSEVFNGQRAVLLRLTEGGADCLSLRKCNARLILLHQPLMNGKKEG